MPTTMKPIVLAILGAAAIFFLLSCSEKKNNDITTNINKDGSIESSVQVKHLDSINDILVTTHTIWIKNNEFKTVVYRDTLPALGLTTKDAENQEGEKKIVQVQKEYEIFLTIR